MNDLRQAAQQALEAYDKGLPMTAAAAMSALRAALEQPEPRRKWQGLTDEEIDEGRVHLLTEDLCGWSFRQGVIFAEQALKEKNHE